MADGEQVQVAAEDVEAVSGKLGSLYESMPAGEQQVLLWLLSRAASASADVQGYAGTFLFPNGVLSLAPALGLSSASPGGPRAGWDLATAKKA